MISSAKLLSEIFAINTHLLTEFGQDAASGMADTECFVVLTIRSTARYILKLYDFAPPPPHEENHSHTPALS